MKRFYPTTCLLIAGWVVACGSSGSSSTGQDEPAVASFAGQGNKPADRSCNVDADCDNHDPCTTFTCKRDSGEIALGRCVYALSSGAGCTAPDAGTAYIAPPDAAGVDAAPVDAGIGPSACSKALSVKITSQNLPTCVFNSTVEASSPATLSYACDGGNATVTFGAQQFLGTETGGNVNVSNVSTYDFVNTKYNVTCKYKATQTITGTLASGKVAWAYSEVLEPKQPALCPFVTAACTGTGDVTVQ